MMQRKMEHNSTLTATKRLAKATTSTYVYVGFDFASIFAKKKRIERRAWKFQIGNDS